MFTVNVIINSNKPYTKRRENHLKIFSRFNILSSKSGQIFYDYAVDASGLNFVQNRTKTGTIIIRSRVTIIICFIHKRNTRMILKIRMNKFTLIQDTITDFTCTIPASVLIFIIFGQTIVSHCSVFFQVWDLFIYNSHNKPPKILSGHLFPAIILVG